MGGRGRGGGECLPAHIGFLAATLLFALDVPAEAKKLEKHREPQAPRKRKVAKIRPAQPMRVAQQQHFGFGFFGSNAW